MSDGFVRTGLVDVDKKIDAEKLSVGGAEVFRLRTAPGPAAIRLDESTPGVLYVGEASPGSSTSNPVWRIRKVLTVGTEISILFPNGSSDFAFSWDDRGALSYQ